MRFDPAGRRVSLLLAGLLLWATSSTAAPSKPRPRLFDRVLIIVLENQDYADALADPYLGSLAGRGALLTRYEGLSHPSYNNYLGLVAGRTFAVRGDDQQDVPGRTVVDLLEAQGLEWRAYAEGYPGGCYLGSSRWHYARKHVPFLSFPSITSVAARCARIVDSDQFAADLRHPPAYAFYTPDQKHDGHDTGLAYGSGWLKGFLEPLLADTGYMSGTLIVVTFDESRSDAHNHVYTVLLGPMVRPGAQDALPRTHYSLLRTIEDNFGLGTLGAEDARAQAIGEVWRRAGLRPVRASAR